MSIQILIDMNLSPAWVIELSRHYGYSQFDLAVRACSTGRKAIPRGTAIDPLIQFHFCRNT
jgi:hypothetical protein